MTTFLRREKTKSAFHTFSCELCFFFSLFSPCPFFVLKVNSTRENFIVKYRSTLWFMHMQKHDSCIGKNVCVASQNVYILVLDVKAVATLMRVVQVRKIRMSACFTGARQRSRKNMREGEEMKSFFRQLQGRRMSWMFSKCNLSPLAHICAVHSDCATCFTRLFHILFLPSFPSHVDRI